jgi:hypothetical protein
VRELRDQVDLCLHDGTLNPESVGWSRRPLHRTNLRGWGRTKRWEYWGIVTPTHVIGLTISSLDYAAVHQCYVLDRATGVDRELGALVPLARGAVLPDDVPPITTSARARGLALEFEDVRGISIGSSAETAHVLSWNTIIRADIGDTRGSVQVDAVARSAGESLSVVVPWSRRRFQYTVKDLARPITGSIVIDGIEHTIPDGSWAVLDRGRGRWPYRMTWNWAAGSGVVDGRRIGLQLGGRWTEGTGMTENAVIVDGVVDPIPVEVEWEYDLADPDRPWRITGDRVDATLTPFHVRRASTNALVIASDTVQAFGEWSGWAATSDGARLRIDGLVGWAEEARNRW